jgi:hypothetical protein
LPWTWQTGAHTVGLYVDPDNRREEASEFNNRIIDRADALAVGLWVEQGLYNDFHARQRNLEIGSNSWEDWAQRQMAFWNFDCINAVWPDSPNGVTDRVRIDRIVVVPDGALPLKGGLPSNNPTQDKTMDLMWGFNSALRPMYSSYKIEDSNAFYREMSLVHELGHARYLIDHYGFDVANQVNVTENGMPIYGTPLLPLIARDIVYYNQFGGVMNGPYERSSVWSPAEALAHNRIAGKRATKGNQNAPGTIGEYLNDIPKHTQLHFALPDGTPLAEAEVKLYPAEGSIFPDKISQTLYCDENGNTEIEGSPFLKTGRQELLFRIAWQGQVFYQFLEAHSLNMAYWRGQTEEANVLVEVFPLDTQPTLRVTGFGHTIPNDRAATSPQDQTDFGSVQFIPNAPHALPDYATKLMPHVARTFVLQNRGGQRLTVQASISGPHASDFTIAQGADSIAPGAITSYGVMFIPQGVGMREATVTLTTNDAEHQVFRFKVQGMGSAEGER